jgi:hypothetical protein
MLRARCWLPLLAAVCLAGPAPLRAQDVNWQEAVARLARERTQAETCASVLKKYGDTAAIGRGAIAYGHAKAEYDGIIAGLAVALARRQQPVSLPDLEGKLRRGFGEREAFCTSVQPLIPGSKGDKGLIDSIVSGVVGPLVEALKAIYLRSRDDDALIRKTIETQLEATAWSSFAAVSPSS